MKSILIFEDEDTIASLLEIIIEALGFKSTRLIDFNRADPILLNNKFDLAIVDLNLGLDIDGLGIISELKDIDPNLITILATGEHIEKSLHQKVDHIVSKPFDTKSLMALLQK